MGVEALRMALRPSERNQASQGLLNREFRPLSVEHLFGIGACPGREPGWRAVPLRLGSRGHSQVWWHSHTQPQSGS